MCSFNGLFLLFLDTQLDGISQIPLQLGAATRLIEKWDMGRGDAFSWRCPWHTGSSRLSSTLCWLDVEVQVLLIVCLFTHFLWAPKPNPNPKWDFHLLSFGTCVWDGVEECLTWMRTKFSISKENFVWMKISHCIPVSAVSPCVYNSSKPFINWCSYPSPPSAEDSSMSDLVFLSFYIFLIIMTTIDLGVLFLYLQAQNQCSA